MNLRESNWHNAAGASFDAVIIGGGINGASIYKQLCDEGYKVLLIDKGDFSSGTSQSSGMMIWGGLLYLKDFHFSTVYRLCRDRSRILELYKNEVSPKQFRYILSKKYGHNKFLVALAVYLYWFIGLVKTKRPQFQNHFKETDFLKTDDIKTSLIMEEGFLADSDSRFVLDWILSNQNKYAIAMNYCSTNKGQYSKKDKEWTLELKDHFKNRNCTIKSKIVINCAGVWTDQVNKEFNIEATHKHVFSKGVFVAFQRPKNLHDPLTFDLGINDDTITLIPWGSVALWGPTENMVESIEEGFSPNSDDINFLLHHASKHLKDSITNSPIVSLRCGIRPLAVKKSFNETPYPLKLSRAFKIDSNKDRPWISVYGGKISGCLSMAEQVTKIVLKKITPTGHITGNNNIFTSDHDRTTFPGLSSAIPTVKWSVDNEFCCTLDDYLRRRTNIAQQIPREGLGQNDENLEIIKAMAKDMPDYQGRSDSLINDYVEKVKNNFDKLTG